MPGREAGEEAEKAGDPFSMRGVREGLSKEGPVSPNLKEVREEGQGKRGRLCKGPGVGTGLWRNRWGWVQQGGQDGWAEGPGRSCSFMDTPAASLRRTSGGEPFPLAYLKRAPP